MSLLIAGVVGYLLGSFPMGYWFGLLQRKDLLKPGAGLVDGTRLVSALGVVGGLLALMLELAQGLLAVAAGELAGHAAGGHFVLGGLLAGVAAVWGHRWPLWLGFRGGKGASVAVGVLLAVQPWLAAIGLAVYILIYLIRKAPAQAGLTTALLMPLAAAALGREAAWLWFGILGALPFIFDLYAARS